MILQIIELTLIMKMKTKMMMMKILVSDEDLNENKSKKVDKSGLVPLDHYRTEIFEEIKKPDNLTGIEFSRFRHLNSILGGHREGEITLLSGHTGTSKTTLACELSLNLLMQDVPTLWCSFEVPVKNILKTMLTQMAREKLDKKPELFQENFNTLSNLPLFLLDVKEFPKTFKEQKQVLIDLVEKYQIRHLIVDNIQFFSNLYVDKRDMESLRRQDLYYSFFRKLASEYSCHITLICHPVKVQDYCQLSNATIGGTSRIVQDSDSVLILQTRKDKTQYIEVQDYCQLSNATIGGTSRIVQDSDSVLILQTRKDKTQYIELTKNRHSGIRGKFKVAFNAESLSYAIEEFNE